MCSIGSAPISASPLQPGKRVARKWFLFALIGLTTSFLGCVATYTTNSFASPDGNYLVHTYLRGSLVLGRGLYDESGKLLVVTLISDDPSRPGSYRKKFHIYGSYVHWHDIWDDHDSLSLLIYDYGANVGGMYAKIRKNPGAPMQYRCTIKFDSTNGILRQVLEREPGTLVDWTNNILIWGR
jgi:hypothetical protein